VANRELQLLNEENSGKHAFKNQKNGRLINAFVVGENRVKLRYSDSCVWAESNESTQSIGLYLIDSFVVQIDGI